MKKWITKDGVEIPYKKLKDDHLANILNFIYKKSKEGVRCICGGGSDSDDIWYDEETIFGEDVKVKYGYYELKKEQRRRIATQTK